MQSALKYRVRVQRRQRWTHNNIDNKPTYLQKKIGKHWLNVELYITYDLALAALEKALRLNTDIFLAEEIAEIMQKCRISE